MEDSSEKGGGREKGELRMYFGEEGGEKKGCKSVEGRRREAEGNENKPPML
jgi:hypothetical protein